MANNETHLLCLRLAGSIVELYDKIDYTDDTRKIYDDISTLLNKLHHENALELNHQDLNQHSNTVLHHI